MKTSSLPPERLQAWAYLNNIELRGVTIASRVVGDDAEEKGGGLIAMQDHAVGDHLVVVPTDMILDQLSITDAARVDSNLREVLDAVGTDFTQSSRKAIILFLLVQLTYATTGASDSGKVGGQSPFRDYARSLPKQVPLPTFYTSERELLWGTSLADALDQKLDKLQLEFDHLKDSTQSLKWCRDLWWDEDRGLLSFDDWKLVDALYRSRALELPRGTGDSMAPVIDMVNHASDGKHNAGFTVDHFNEKLILHCKNRSIKAGEEITISYGYGGACEMLFSYGFLEKHAQSAREMFLKFSIPDDDPLKHAKIEIAKEAPGVRIFVDEKKQTQWESEMIWWACINEEDGLEVQVLRQNDGSTELAATWKGVEIEPNGMKEKILADEMRDVYCLRAAVLMLNCVESQGAKLTMSENLFEAVDRGFIHNSTLSTIRQLRELELDLLATCHESIENEKTRLLDSEKVRAYLLNQQDSFTPTVVEEGMDGEDFS